MSSLRRDLIERRLWPVVVVLIAAIIAVPFLVHSHGGSGSASTLASVPPASAGGSSPDGGQSIPISVHHQQRAQLYTSSTRDPFEAALASSVKAESHARASTSTTSTTSASTDQVASGPSSESKSSSSSVDSGSGGSASSSTSTTQTSTTARTSTTPSSTSPTGTGPWTIHETSAVVRGHGFGRTGQDLARLTPLPSAAAPTVMYIGLSSDDHQAVFALATGVDATGRGECLPSKTDCALIGLANGQTENFIYLLSNGTERTMSLKATISSHVTSESSEVSAALAPSQIGLCEVELGDPIQFSYDQAGTTQEGSSKSACHRGMKAVPFPGSGSGQ